MGRAELHPQLITTATPKRIVITTIGSLGDLHPCLALGVELGRRGHRVKIASTEYYRSKVEELGIKFHSIRPNWDPTDRELIRQCEDLKQGPGVLYRKLILPALRATYDDLISVAAGADLMIAGELVYAAPLVAEKLSLRWVSQILSPFSFFSSHDPSILVNCPSLIHLRKVGWKTYRAGLSLAASRRGIGLIQYAICAGNWDCARTAILFSETSIPRIWSWRSSRAGWLNRSRIGLDKLSNPAFYILIARKQKALLHRS